MKFKLDRKYICWGVTAFLVIAASILLYYLMFHPYNITDAMRNIVKVCMPIIDGLVLAYILTPILNTIENKYIMFFCHKMKWSTTGKNKRRIRAIGILCSAFIVILIIYGLISMLVSQIVPSIQNIASNFDNYISDFSNWITNLLADNKNISNFVLDAINKYSVELEQWLNGKVLPQTSTIIKTLSLSVISFFKVLWNFILGFVISIYILANKELLAGQAKKIVYAVFKTNLANAFIREVRFVHKTFIGFLSGKVVDSIIIGLLCFIGTTIMGTPYAVLVSVIVGVTNVIPFFGPYIGAIPCGILILIVDLAHPMNCVYFAIFILILQQFDGNVLGPKILGDSTGLSSFWVIFAITLFGGLFGVVGMIIGVPLFAVLFSGIKRTVNYVLQKRGLSIETKDYLKVGSIQDKEYKEYIPEAKKNKAFGKKTNQKNK